MSFIIAEHYYNILNQFASTDYTPTWGHIPLDEDRIIVNMDTREMILPSTLSDFIAMAKDHRSQTVYFEVDRYFEDVDLASLTCVVEYITPPSEDGTVDSHLRLYPITLKNTNFVIDKDGNKYEKLFLAWSLGAEATSQAGVLSFALHFFKVNKDTKSLAYSLRTKPCKGNIAKGLDVGQNGLEESDDYYSVNLNHFQILIDMINQKNVYWHDV